MIDPDELVEEGYIYMVVGEKGGILDVCNTQELAEWMADLYEGNLRINCTIEKYSILKMKGSE